MHRSMVTVLLLFSTNTEAQVNEALLHSCDLMELNVRNDFKSLWVFSNIKTHYFYRDIAT